jgi:hypothetical protein
MPVGRPPRKKKTPRRDDEAFREILDPKRFSRKAYSGKSSLVA